MSLAGKSPRRRSAGVVSTGRQATTAKRPAVADSIGRPVDTAAALLFLFRTVQSPARRARSTIVGSATQMSNGSRKFWRSGNSQDRRLAITCLPAALPSSCGTGLPFIGSHRSEPCDFEPSKRLDGRVPVGKLATDERPVGEACQVRDASLGEAARCDPSPPVIEGEVDCHGPIWREISYAVKSHCAQCALLQRNTLRARPSLSPGTVRR